MNTGTVELELQDGTAIKIKGSTDFVAAVSAVIFEVSKGTSSEHLQQGEPKESFQAGKLPPGGYVENHELEAPAEHPPRGQSGCMNQRLCWSLKEAAERCGVSYHTLYRQRVVAT
jgi:hypothetical protein